MTSILTKKYDFDTVFDSQKVFRLVLEAMSNPSKIVNIKEYIDKLHGNNAVFLTIAMTLLDNEVHFYACADDTLSDEIGSLTFAKKEQLENADFVFVGKSANINQIIENVKCGTLADPHKSATIIILNDSEPDCRATFYGPGIDGQIEMDVSRTVKDSLEFRHAQNYEYPQGIDLIFVSSEGELFTIPRLVKQREDADES